MLLNIDLTTRGDKMILTLKQLKEFGDSEIIATGTGTYEEITTKEIRWVAVSGNGYFDWTIYYLESDQSINKIKREGDKLYSKDIIKRLVPCDKEAMEMYRK